MASPSRQSPASSRNSLRSVSPSAMDEPFSPSPRPRAETVHLTPYSHPPPAYLPMNGGSQPGRPSWASHDPRSSSTQSLVPSESGIGGRRTLLLIYIHGFLGNETSFQSFPAHVHNLLKVTMAETHVIHTKIYPRYRSRKAIEFARDDFSRWLEPHESPTTDVILLGHSMGGLLSAEVVLLPPFSPATGQPFRHRILGTINFDTPFLGMHPGVIVSGIGSLFRPAPPPPKPLSVPEGSGSPSSSRRPSEYNDTTSGISTGTTYSHPPLSPSNFESTSTLSTLTSTLSGNTIEEGAYSELDALSPSDPNYNPPFPNDIRLSNRSGWDSTIHFVLKHADSLPTATKKYVMSHLEFGGCMADFSGLKSRYARIRELEDVDDLSETARQTGSRRRRRVRFVNYYTASTGILKNPKSPKIPVSKEPVEFEMQDMSLSRQENLTSTSTVSSPRVSVEEHRDPGQEPADGTILVRERLSSHDGSTDHKNHPEDMNDVEPQPVDDVNHDVAQTTDQAGATNPPSTPTSLQRLSSLPSIPPMPDEPPFFDPGQYPDKDTRKLAEREHGRAVKAYKQAVKDRNKTIKDRRKMVEKLEKKARQEREKELKLEEKLRLKEEKEEELRESKAAGIHVMRPANDTTNKKPPRDKKFCMLPPKIAGQPDPTWIRVFMEGVDEVGAHCGLFFVGKSYEQLVGDVGARIEEWIKEDETLRTIREMEHLDMD